MDLIERNSCAVTGARDLEPLFTFKDFPALMGCTAAPPALDLKADMPWTISRSSGLIQLASLLPINFAYAESHGAGLVGAAWRQHHRAFAGFLRQFNPSSVLEIGGAHGILAKEYAAAGAAAWTILDPAPAPVAGCPARFVKGFFDDGFDQAGPFDALVLSHVLEHLHSPAAVMERLAGTMAQGARLVFSVPNLRVWLERGYTSCLNFEHTLLITEPYIEFLLARHGFRLLKREYFREDHSIFYAAVRDSAAAPAALRGGLYEEHKKLYQGFLRFHSDFVKNINAKLAAASQPVYMFGAHVFTQFLLAFGLDAGRLAGLLDNDPAKQGRRLYGTRLSVSPPEVLAGLKEPVVILRAGAYSGEIKQDILSNVNPGTAFWD